MTEDDTSKAYAAVSAKLDSWTSPQVGRISSNWRTYEDDAVQWMETTMGQTIALTPQKRPAEYETSPATPVTSNSGKKSDRSVSPLNLSEIPPYPSMSNLLRDEYCLHHDALLRFLRSKKSIQQRMDDDVDAGKHHTAVDCEFLQSLGTHSLLWSLLARLRSLGLDSLWMDDTPGAKRQQQASLSDTLARLARSPVTTHAHLIEKLYADESALILKRRKALVEWMQDCASQQQVKLPSPQTEMWPDSTKALLYNMQRPDKISSLHPDAPLLVSEQAETLFGKDGKNDDDLLSACLQHVLAGCIDKAVDLCKKQGQPWRAALWQGGSPFHIASFANHETSSTVEVCMGNPDRILWKSQCRKLAKKTTGSESSIYAILSNDVQSSLANASLRSWERGLQACFTALVGRTEDELLHRYNGNLRDRGRVVIGSANEEEEMEHLMATLSVTTLNEYTIFDTLEASPYEDLRASSLVRKLMSAFIKGRMAVEQVFASPSFHKDYKSNLRLVTHLLIFMDSIRSFQMNVEGITRIKDDVVLEYVEELARNPDLAQFTILYASTLPRTALLTALPSHLVNVHSSDQRRLVWQQMNDLLDVGVDVDILQRVVRLILADPNATEVQKCQSIGWLCFTPDHYGPALICANQLVRKLLLAGKTSIASQFLWEYFPTIVQHDGIDQFASAKREYSAFLVFLEANNSFERWKECMIGMVSENTASPCVLGTMTAKEKEIARQMEKRRLVEQKREGAHRVIDAASIAQSKLFEVLSFDGGWLQDYDEDDDTDSPDEEQHQSELEILRFRLIPETCFLLHNVLSETGMWMKNLLEDGVPVVGNNTNEVLHVLDNVDGLSPFAPRFWLKQAHALANTVASEEHGIYDAFGVSNLKYFLELMEDITTRLLEATDSTSSSVNHTSER